jgi:hypothetical protein
MDYIIFVSKIIFADNLSLIASIPLSSTLVREITIVRNNSLMLVADFDLNQIRFFDIISTNNYTSSTPSAISMNRTCGLHAANDSFIYVAPWSYSVPVSNLIFSNNTWISSSLPNTTPSSGNRVFQPTIDSCGRLWLAVTGYGFQIFDP